MTKINRTGAMAALALAAIPAALLAQPTPGQGAPASLTKADAQARAAEMFARMDVNKDGKLDQADRAARQGEHFARMDTDKDGKLSAQEFTAGRPKREGMAEGRKGPGKMGRHGGGHRGPEGMMGRMADANKDGAVSRDEFLAAQGKRFEMMDADKNGTVTAEERQAARAKMREHMRGMRGARDKAADQTGHEGH